MLRDIYICSGSLNEVRSRDSGLSDEANIEYLQENLTQKRKSNNLKIYKVTRETKDGTQRKSKGTKGGMWTYPLRDGGVDMWQTRIFEYKLVEGRVTPLTMLLKVG